MLPLLTATSVLAAPAVVHADTVWLCRPGANPNPCTGSLKTTVRTFGEPAKVVTPKVQKKQREKLDCFYVYPTVSSQPTPVSTLEVTSSETSIAQYQAARFNQVCKVYAPMYRQITLRALLSGGATPEDRENAYADVRSAFLQYRSENPNRPFVLIGHSQGSGMIKRLMAEFVDQDPVLRSQMVSALVTGSTVSVPVGQTVGGDFQNIPLCTRAKQVGCIVTFATFGQTVPTDSLFGRTRSGVGVEAGCTNPAALASNERTEAITLMRGTPLSGLLSIVANTMYGGKVPRAKTPWLRPADRYTVKCVKSNGAHVLMAKPVGKSKALKPGPSPVWGLHLFDINLPLGDLVNVVKAQQKAISVQ